MASRITRRIARSNALGKTRFSHCPKRCSQKMGGTVFLRSFGRGFQVQSQLGVKRSHSHWVLLAPFDSSQTATPRVTGGEPKGSVLESRQLDSTAFDKGKPRCRKRMGFCRDSQTDFHCPGAELTFRRPGSGFRFDACPRRESNSHLRFRKPSFYPLNYGDARTCDVRFARAECPAPYTTGVHQIGLTAENTESAEIKSNSDQLSVGSASSVVSRTTKRKRT